MTMPHNTAPIMVYNGSGIWFSQRPELRWSYGGTEIRFESVAAALALREKLDSWIRHHEQTSCEGSRGAE